MVVVKASEVEAAGLWWAWCEFWFEVFRLALVVPARLAARVIQPGAERLRSYSSLAARAFGL